jgi:hypothetical protein
MELVLSLEVLKRRGIVAFWRRWLDVYLVSTIDFLALQV